MRWTRFILVVACVVVVAGTVQAQTVRWSYIEGGAAAFDPDRGDRESGWFLGGSAGLGNIPIHIIGEFGDYGDIDIWNLGAGWHGLLGERADLFADASFYDADYDDGLKIRFGVRWMVSKRTELNGNLGWTHLEFRDNASLNVNVIFGLGKTFGIGGGVEWGDNWSFARIFARFSFGK